MKKFYPLGTLAFLLLFLSPSILSAQCAIFYDGFESGLLGPAWQFGPDAYTRTVSTTAPAQGTYSLTHNSSGSGSFYQGTYATFTPSQPEYFSFWMKTNTTNTANGYVVIGNSNIANDNGILFCYFNTTSQLRFFNTTGYNHNIVANQWYHIEARDVDWVNRNMDIYIDNVLILTNWAFRSGTANDVDRVHLFSLNAATPEYDEILIGQPGPVISNISLATPNCIGDANGGIDITATSVNGNITYNWSTGATTEDLTNISAGTYTVSLTDPLGCIVTDSITLSDPSAIAPTPSITSTTCPSSTTGAIDLSTTGGTPGYNYSWNTGATTEDLLGIAAGTYHVTITDANNCTLSDSFTVQGPAPFDLQDSITIPTCFAGSDGEINLNPTGGTPGYTYNWSTGATTAGINGLSSGTYTVTLTDNASCSTQVSFVVIDPAQIAGNGVPNNLDCFGDQSGGIDLTPGGGTPAYSFTWNTGAILEDLSNLNAGTYTVTITDANGCTRVESYPVTEPAAINVTSIITNATTLPSDGAIDITVTGGTPAFTYNWSNGATTQDLSNVAAGNYGVTITDANGCTSTNNFFVDLVQSTFEALDIQVNTWPNPFHQTFSLEIQGMGTDPIAATLLDLTGRPLWQQLITADGKQEVSLDLPSGIYLLQLRQGNAQKTLKINRE